MSAPCSTLLRPLLRREYLPVLDSCSEPLDSEDELLELPEFESRDEVLLILLSLLKLD